MCTKKTKARGRIGGTEMAGGGWEKEKDNFGMFGHGLSVSLECLYFGSLVLNVTAWWKVSVGH